MPNLVNHGGNCCGIRHYYNFWSSRYQTTEQYQQELRSFPVNSGGRTKGKVIEAVITDTQFRQDPELAQKLKDQGFKLVTRFSNSTGGLCNVLHRVGGERNFKRGRQPAWVRILRESE